MSEKNKQDKQDKQDKQNKQFHLEKLVAGINQELNTNYTWHYIKTHFEYVGRGIIINDDDDTGIYIHQPDIHWTNSTKKKIPEWDDKCACKVDIKYNFFITQDYKHFVRIGSICINRFFGKNFTKKCNSCNKLSKHRLFKAVCRKCRIIQRNFKKEKEYKKRFLQQIEFDRTHCSSCKILLNNAKFDKCYDCNMKNKTSKCNDCSKPINSKYTLCYKCNIADE